MRVKTKIKWIIMGVCIIVTSYLVSTFLYQFTLIRGDSMSPSYHDGQIVILDKHSRAFDAGDVIVFYCKEVEANMIKRIVACPGDYVVITDGKLYVNDKLSTIYQGNKEIDYGGIAEKGLLLGDGQYFVLGDNIVKSRDSRYEEIGVVDEEDIIGEVM